MPPAATLRTTSPIQSMAQGLRPRCRHLAPSSVRAWATQRWAGVRLVIDNLRSHKATWHAGVGRQHAGPLAYRYQRLALVVEPVAVGLAGRRVFVAVRPDAVLVSGLNREGHRLHQRNSAAGLAVPLYLVQTLAGVWPGQPLDPGGIRYRVQHQGRVREDQVRLIVDTRHRTVDPEGVRVHPAAGLPSRGRTEHCPALARPEVAYRLPQAHGEAQ